MDNPHPQPMHEGAENEWVDPETLLLSDERIEPIDLRALYRYHILWLFGSTIILVLGTLLPDSALLWRLFRGLVMLLGLVLSVTRLWMLNGVAAEMKRRGMLPEEEA